MKSKNFGLSRIAFQELLADLQKGDDDLYQRIFLAHFEDCMNYLKRQYNASHQDAYDASMDTLVVFCDRLKKGRVQYGNLRFLFTQMAGQHYLKTAKSDSRTTELTDEWDVADLSEPEMSAEVFAAFDQAWPQLGKDCRQLLKSFFYDRAKLKDIAKENGKSEAALRKQKQRCMSKLQTIFQSLYK